MDAISLISNHVLNDILSRNGIISRCLYLALSVFTYMYIKGSFMFPQDNYSGCTTAKITAGVVGWCDGAG